ncbi:septal ring lytic transglycosylase RlpA family protein [Thermosediminibacter oceani]|uniref:Probable endolytic peptidoglycan transglycosylase RlpA n=1 Tax=Thermosediminibacter oceani (strain ATCC BAA-1034 / DSM 16646 / JW/IW-1228P) TaxID=555079 RepID=D9S0H2_THEOJ|nr:septal ring lytic transglycosylase RlpA family protein [Thermosediminibacter oceani]ADL08830.1 rare lipoprotein A [Thermosediminibacter oceani DSM 16646]
MAGKFAAAIIAALLMVFTVGPVKGSETAAMPVVNVKSRPVCYSAVREKSAVERQVSKLPSRKKVFTGKASWYGPGFHGKRTASGQVFNQESLTAAHRYLPFGTRVKVTNLENGKSVAVVINDRGPYVKGRHIDLSKKAAEMLGMIESGVVPVMIEIE